jgi:serine/threonine-protein kinase RsbW
MTEWGLACILPLPHPESGNEVRRMSERHNELKSSTDIAHSAGPVLRIAGAIPSETTAISPFVDQLMLFIKRFRCVSESEIDVEISLREALANAVVHGNHEDPHKYVYVSVRCIPDEEVSIAVRDEGKGFNNTELPNPTAPEQLESKHGRGVYLMTTLMDEVHFERGGSIVHMRKKCAKTGNVGGGVCDE